MSDLNRDEMESALAELAGELNARDVKAKIYLVGGAVMVLAFDARFTKGDIDGAMFPTDEVLAVSAEIGVRRGLGAEWLNNSASQFVPVFKEPNWQPILKSGNVEIVAADERSMLAMKMRAGRGSRDRPDIVLLVKRCGISSVAEAQELYEEYFPEDPLPDRTLPLLDEAIEALGPSDHDSIGIPHGRISSCVWRWRRTPSTSAPRDGLQVESETAKTASKLGFRVRPSGSEPKPADQESEAGERRRASSFVKTRGAGRS